MEVSFYCLGHAPGVGLGRAWGSKTLALGFAMAPHRLRVLDFKKHHCVINVYY